MWTSENRARYDRDELRYPSDVTDAEWALIEPLIPAAKRGGRRRKTDMRQTFNAVMYLLSTGCQWRYLPKDFPPQGTVRRYFDAWNWRGGLGRMHDALYEFCRAQEGREACPTAAIIDSQSVKSAEKRGVSHRFAKSAACRILATMADEDKQALTLDRYPLFNGKKLMYFRCTLVATESLNLGHMNSPKPAKSFVPK